MVSSVALEIAAVVSALPMRHYRSKYQKYLNEVENNKDKLTKTRVRTVLLGTAAVTMAVVGVKLNKKKDIEEITEDVKKVSENPEISTIVEKTSDIEETKKEAVAEAKSEVKEVIVEETIEEKTEGTSEDVTENTSEEKDELKVEVEEIVADEEEPHKDWKCEECGHKNEGTKKVCSYCGTLRADILSQALKEW